MSLFCHQSLHNRRILRATQETWEWTSKLYRGHWLNGSSNVFKCAVYLLKIAQELMRQEIHCAYSLKRLIFLLYYSLILKMPVEKQTKHFLIFPALLVY